METKICSKCKTEKPMTFEYFGNSSKSKDGFRCECKGCRKKYNEENREHINEHKKQYREENKEKIAKQKLKYNGRYVEREALYRLNNKERISELNRSYREENQEKVSAYLKNYYKNNKPKFKTYSKVNRLKYKNSEKRIQYLKKYRELNKANKAKDTQKYRSKKLELPATFTKYEWKFAKQYFDGNCCYCGKKHDLAQEHFIPQSKNGGYTKCNIVPSCKSCNSSKGTSLFSEWYPTYKHYSKEREQKILSYLSQMKEPI